MKKSELEIILDEIDFLDKANNIYETKTYIIRQEVSVEIINGITVVYSRDTFYAKTGLRMSQLEFLKSIRPTLVNAKRVPATMTTRTYKG
jgi:hypothetical protein